MLSDGNEKAAVRVSVPNVLPGALYPMCTREDTERGRHKNGLYSRVDGDGIAMLPMNLVGVKSQ